MLLPELHVEADYTPLRWTAAVWQPALREVCDRHGLDPGAFERATDGTHVVWLSRDVVIKLFVRLWPEDFAREVAALDALEGAALPAPRLLGRGELEGWPYVLIERVAGAPIKAVWGDLAPRERVDLAEQTGALLARLHAIPVERCGPALVHDWRAFVAARVERAGEHHARGGADARQVAELDAFLRDAPPVEVAPRLLHADLTHDHLLVAAERGRWRVTGIIDWADAMTGDPLYDLAVPAAFLAQGRPGVGRALLAGYGLEADRGLTNRLLFALLIHRYGHLSGVLRHAHGAPSTDLAGLRRALWEM